MGTNFSSGLKYHRLKEEVGGQAAPAHVDRAVDGKLRDAEFPHLLHPFLLLEVGDVVRREPHGREANAVNFLREHDVVFGEEGVAVAVAVLAVGIKECADQDDRQTDNVGQSVAQELSFGDVPFQETPYLLSEWFFHRKTECDGGARALRGRGTLGGGRDASYNATNSALLSSRWLPTEVAMMPAPCRCASSETI